MWCTLSITRSAVWMYITREETMALLRHVRTRGENMKHASEWHAVLRQRSQSNNAGAGGGGRNAWWRHGSPWERRMGKGHTLSTGSHADKRGHRRGGKQSPPTLAAWMQFLASDCSGRLDGGLSKKVELRSKGCDAACFPTTLISVEQVELWQLDLIFFCDLHDVSTHPRKLIANQKIPFFSV